MLVAIPLTMLGGLILLLVAAGPIVALGDRLDEDVANWWGVLIFAGLVAVATAAVRLLVGRDWVPLDLPAWALLLLVLPVIEEILNPTSDAAGWGYLLLILLVAFGTTIRLIAFHVFAHRARLRRQASGH
jgi:hypothetical protein